MNRATFDDYIRRFNAQDPTAFEDYLHAEVRVQNGGLVFHGIDGMKAHYAKIWGTFIEALDVQRFVSDEDTVAIEMKAHFDAHRDDPESLFGPVSRGEQFDYHGVIMYRLADGRFIDLRVAYLSFTHTLPDGAVVEMGLAH